MHGNKTKKAIKTNKRKTEEPIHYAEKYAVKKVIEISDDSSTDEELKEKSEKKHTNACDRLPQRGGTYPYSRYKNISV